MLPGPALLLALALGLSGQRPGGPEELRAAEVEAARRRAVETERAHGPFDPRTGTAWNDLGVVLDVERADEARRAFERAIEAYERSLGPEHAFVASPWNNLGRLLHDLGDRAGARACYERALAIREAALGPDDLATAACLNNLALVLRETGELEAARPLYERAVAAYERRPEADPFARAGASSNLADLLLALGEPAAALPLYERAHAVREATLGSDHPLTVRSLTARVVALLERGEPERARPLAERAAALAEEHLGPEHPDTGWVLRTRGALLAQLGLLAEARASYERALAVREAALGPEHPATMESLADLAALLDALGDRAAARPLHERALDVLGRTVGEDHAAAARSLNDFGVHLWAAGEHERARELLDRALTAWERTAGPRHPSTAQCLVNLGQVLTDTGRAAEAVALLERARAIQVERLGPDHPLLAISLNDLALARRASGDAPAALPLLRRSHAILAAALGPAHPSTERAVRNVAFELVDLGRASEAWELFADGLERRRSSRAVTLAALTEAERYLRLAAGSWHLEAALELAAASGDERAGVLAYEEVLAWKGLVARQLLASRGRLLASAAPAERALLDDLRATQARLSALATRADAAGPAEAAARLAAARREREELERALVGAASAGSTGAEPASYAALRAALPPRSAALDLLVHARRADRRPRVSAWVVRPELAAPVRLDLGPAAELEAAVRDHLGALAARRGDALGARRGVAPGEHVAAAGRLRALLWDPLVEHLAGVELVLVSPDGVLAGLPLETLALADGTFLLERHGFVYLQDLTWLAGRGAPPPARLDSLLAVGGVDFGRRAPLSPAEEAARLATGPAVRGGFADSWDRLPATRRESRAVHDLHAAELGERGTRLLLQDEAATEERLQRELGRHRLVHLATHGYFEPAGVPSLWAAARAAAAEDRPWIEREGGGLAGRLPGLLSGLVCSGASVADEAREDGYLTAEEVGWLDLGGVELVVLSACETGLGRPQSGEGLLGLRRAFLTAGARTVVSSLWSVPDESTAELMQEFYRHLLRRGAGRLEALRAAQLAQLEQSRSVHGDPRPATWGAFVLSGEWR